MVMGFALCASVAFAQTSRISHESIAPTKQKAPNAVKAPVDYKASIFGKANGHDTIQVFKFDVASDYTFGQIASSDRINDTLVGSTNCHTIAGDANKWMRYGNLSDFRSNVATRQTGLSNMWSGVAVEYIAEDLDPANVSPREPADDGFMLISYQEGSATSGRINAYFTLPTVQRPASAKMIEVSITQIYRKYYDQCFIDYKVGNNWYAREINVTGIDMGVNDWGANKARFVMPHDLNTETNIQLRIRAYSSSRNVRSFGYFWGIDNVAVMALTLDEYWALNSATNVDGFYGMVPEGMTIPMAWGVNAQNLSINNINNAHATVNAGSSRTSLSPVLSGSNTTVTAGDLNTVYPVLINERGFFNTDYGVTSGYQSWYNHSDNYGNAGALIGGYQGRGLPATTTGKNFYSINVSGGNLSRNYDTILYYVTPMEEFDFAQTGREGGHRWAHDNGVIAGGSSFQVAFTDDGYVTDQGSDPDNGGHVNEAGYSVHVRFNTPSVIPTDADGNPWVFRGLELIAANDRPMGDLAYAEIIPLTYYDEYDGDYLYFRSLPCGISGMTFQVGENDINDQLYTDGGYITPNAGYKAITIQFAEQPVMEPNTSYRFGYRLADEATFALAGSQSSFRFRNDTGAYVNVPFRYGTGVNDTIAQYANAAAAVNDYRYQYTPATYLEVVVYDPVAEDEVYAWNIDNYPLVRPIVGPARPVQYAYVVADCNNNTDTNGVMVTRGNDTICGIQLPIASGSSQPIYFEPMGDHSVIDSVLLDGRKLTAYSEDSGEGDYLTGDASVTAADGSVLLERTYWLYYLSGINPDDEFEFTVYSHWEEHNTIGIDPVAPEVSLGIAPNPATSTVKLNVQGVSGKVNCSILDMSGRVVYNANINAETEHMINVSNIPAGAYFVRVTNDTFSKIEKLIIK